MTSTHVCLQVSRPAQEQKQSPLGSPETAARKHQQTGPGQVGNAPDTITHCTECVDCSTASSTMAAAAKPILRSSSSSTSAGVPAANSVTLAAATDVLAPQMQSVDNDVLRRQEAVPAGGDTSAAPATAEVRSERKNSTDQSAIRKAGVGQGESPRLTENPEGSQAALPSEALPSERKMVAEAASESDAGDGKKMPRAPEPEAEVGGNDAGLATSLWAQPTEANAKVSPASLHERKEKKRLHLSEQFTEKPSITLGCPGLFALIESMHDSACICLQLECKHHLFDLCLVVASTGIRMLDIVTDECR